MPDGRPRDPGERPAAYGTFRARCRGGPSAIRRATDDVPTRSGAHHETSLPVSPTAPALARVHLDGWLSAEIGGRTADRARLAASELVTNAVRHADLPKDAEIGLAADVGPDHVRVTVRQPTSASAAAVVPDADRGPDGGYGLAIVEDVTDRWGADHGPPGVVWFEIDRR